jgi:hypothetical protein
VLAWPLARAGRLGGLVATLGALGGVLLVVVLWREWEELLPWSLATLGGAYTATLLLHRHAVDGGAPLVAAGLLLCGELAAWSLDERWQMRVEPAVLRTRAVALGALILAGLAAAAAVVAVAGAATGSGLAWTTLGAASAVGAVGTGVALLRRGYGGSLH